ncbi:hypothetical protein BACCELL_04051 [Bacteroides cellulosilyticus DSM 14838]|uniref:Uncharacterized protein n=1 Tax=Bacteroides cellulosilyticus DSM 14838 TaxID=537012 RepID=E2NIB8_9BACE|nr:hypothetical protein BACCELL_04051 [Bacteroides cellulosilyticus DSM 14838]
MYFSNSNQLKGYSIHSHTIYSIESCSEGIYADLYRTCSVPAPYRLRVEVSLSGECTEQVQSGYGSGTQKTRTNISVYSLHI